MDQLSMFKLAVEAGTVHFHHVPARGWQLRLMLRRGASAWQDAESVTYEGLTTVELLDVISAHLDAHL